MTTEDARMTTADMLRAEGRAQARAEAVARGYAEGFAEVLLQLLTLKFGPLPEAALETIRTAPTDQLETWNARVLTADTLDEVLG